MSLPQPYVGITGFRESAQVHSLLDLDCGTRELMVGVLAGRNSLLLQQHRQGSRQPKREEIAGIFPGTGYPTVNLVHYHSDTTQAGDLAGELEEALRWGGPNCHGLQLNMAWPDRDALKGFKRVFPTKRIVLQVGGFRRPIELEGDPHWVARRISDRYAGLVDYVLLDASGGLGKAMDMLQMVRYLGPIADIINEDHLPIRLVAAGGLCADTIASVAELCGMFNGLSFDAEGRLHGLNGQLDLAECRRYLHASENLP